MRLEARLALVAIVALPLVERASSSAACSSCSTTSGTWRPGWADTLLAAGFAWTGLVLLRKTAELAAPDDRRPWLVRVARPRTNHARATFAMVLICLMIALIVAPQRASDLPPGPAIDGIISLGTHAGDLLLRRHLHQPVRRHHEPPVQAGGPGPR
jgi:hypothetical protein